MSTDVTITIPIELPALWRTERDSAGNVLLSACGDSGQVLGWVTIDERIRAFGLGVCRPRCRPSDTEFIGRGWRSRLFARAVQALQAATGQAPAC